MQAFFTTTDPNIGYEFALNFKKLGSEHAFCSKLAHTILFEFMADIRIRTFLIAVAHFRFNADICGCRSDAPSQFSLDLKRAAAPGFRETIIEPSLKNQFYLDWSHF